MAATLLRCLVGCECRANRRHEYSDWVHRYTAAALIGDLPGPNFRVRGDACRSPEFGRRLKLRQRVLSCQEIQAMRESSWSPLRRTTVALAVLSRKLPRAASRRPCRSSGSTESSRRCEYHPSPNSRPIAPAVGRTISRSAGAVLGHRVASTIRVRSKSVGTGGSVRPWRWIWSFSTCGGAVGARYLP